ncbi:hypothetical protein [Grimontia sp. NTOU-MAR1]|uniref:hypothetical protein n=1 Tax=Grimontia sp. NTOU-MAR1 TaxID=3111011 RepID=UPI002DBE5C08|nr:hypothetical protein [Grimontia sp. NTOU-MAR1]WRV97722.1 hypothetical protein VP504_17070 [Grimontia sp. NTOU-MAR1]
MKKVLLPVLVFLSSFYAHASDNLTGKVIFTGLYGDGRFFVQTDRLINEPGCEGTRIDVAPHHPQIDRWLSITLSAYTTGGEIQFRTNGCFAGYPTLDNTTQTWLHSKPQ